MGLSAEQIRGFEGVYSATLTPVDKDGELNEEVLRRMIDYQLEQGLRGFFVCGSTGEGYLMDPGQRRKVAEVIVDETGDRGKVIVHVGHLSSNVAADLARHAEKIGAAAISSTPPVYYNVGIEGTLYHYKIISDACSLPFLAYNIPATTIIGLMLENLGSLLEIETFVGMKYTSHNLFEMGAIAQKLGETGIVLSGADEMFLPAQVMGARGAIGSTQNLLPGTFVEIYQAFLARDIDKARELQGWLNQVIRVLLKYGAQAWKATAKGLGFDCGVYRPPFKPLTPEQLKGLYAEMEALGVF